ncbi:glycoside hydrolase family 5 protein [Glonium stellatum]|uniref:mannan endo-1,4-beta-mannosidase n=1 Tax=Glonium stellatum TaxID=574774 RepID=A0A8E2F120_9PEZI|nr:glycoside hydrolase family 5 protein [Glonium stellatum]
MKNLALLSLAAIATAQQSAYSQCGGTGYTGATACVSGYFCQYSNTYYSQCVPGTASGGSGTTLVTNVVKSTSTTTSAAAIAVATGSISKASGTKFTIDGVTKYYAGTNSYWIAFLTNNADVDTVMSHLQSSGLKILRVWGFNDVTSVPGSGTVYFQHFSGSGATINTGANGLQRLDYVVQSAAAHGIKLIINFVNNWTDYGGMAAYMHSCGGSSNPDWYKSSACQSIYQAYIKAVVSRYVNSTAVFAWELANEPRCNGCATSVLTNWIKTTSAYIKSLDPNHMVCIGDEGFGVSGGDGSYPYTSGEGWNWNTNLAISTIDFGTFHLYPSSWGVSNDWGAAWIKNHAAACVAAGKPCLFEEYGVASSHCSVEGSWQSTSLSTAGMAADLFWDEGDTLSTGQTSNDGNTIFYGTSDWTCLVTNHVSAIG